MTKNTNEDFRKLRSEYYSNGVGAGSNRVIESAKGAILYDVEGNEYIDFYGGIGTMNVGHCHPKVVKAIQDQAEKLTHSCFQVNAYPVALTLAERLCSLTPGTFDKKAVFFNSGAEAVENTVKIARYNTKRSGVVVFENGYHGRTLLTMTMTSKVKPFKFGFGPFAPEVYRMPFGDKVGASALKDFFIKYVNPEDIAAVVVEPVQGEGGFVVPPSDYFQELIKICHDNGILFVSDEIQSGMGRTGKMFAIEHWGVEPDLVAVGKSIAAGIPLTAVVGRAELLDAVHTGGLGGTYNGNPVACAAAHAVLDIFETEGMLEKSIALGEKIRFRFKKWQKEFNKVGEVRGIGAMSGFELVKGPDMQPDADAAQQLVNYCQDNGAIVLSCGIYGHVIRCLAPFVITDEQLEKGLSIIENGLAGICK